MLRLIVLWSFFIFLISAQLITSSTQTSIQTSSSTTTNSLGLGLSSTSTSTSTSISTSTTSTTPTTPTTTLGQGPVGQPASTTTGIVGGPTPFTYTTVIGDATQVIIGTFTPTNPTTVPVTPTGEGTVWLYSSWLAAYSPTQTSSTVAGYPLSPIPFTLILIVLLGILGGGGMLYV